MHFDFYIQGGDFLNAGKASSTIKKVLKKLGVNPKTVRSTVIALYEAEVNIVAHADEGTIRVDIDPEKITIVLEDKGPGIADIALAMTKGYSTASKAVREMGFGAGMGLPNMKSNTDEMMVTSEPGIGTQVKLISNLQ